MKKELVLAITIGFILGLIITGGIYVANKSLKNLPRPSLPTMVPKPKPCSKAKPRRQTTPR